MDETDGISSLAPELLKEIFEKCSLNDQLRLRSTCRRLDTCLTPLIPQLSAPEECTITRMSLRKLHNSIHVSVDIDDVATAQHFIALGDRAIRQWKRKENEKMKCWLVFPFPAPKQIPFFQHAKIAHFELDQRLPLHLTSENMQMMKVLLCGCTIFKLSLLFNSSTLTQLEEVPELASMVRAQHVEFVIQTVFDISIIASELAEVGVKEVSITVDSFCDLKLDLGLICELVRAGIPKLTIEAEFGASDWQQKRDYNQLMEVEMSESGTCTNICIRARRLPDYSDGQTSSGPQCTYVSRVKRDYSKDVLGKDELLISTL